MAVYKRPGAYVEEVLLPRNSAVDSSSSSFGTFVGTAPQGPTAATIVRSWADFVALYGSFSAAHTLAYQVFQYLVNGGREAYVLRVVGSGATKATVTLTDMATPAVGTLSVTAANAGSWGNSLSVEVFSTGTDRFDLVVYLGGSGPGAIVERFTGLSMDSGDGRYAVNVIASSAYVTVANLLAATASPDNRPKPGGQKPLVSGTDGSAVSASDHTTALSSLDIVRNNMIINLAGLTDVTANAAAIAYAESRGDSFVVADVASGLTPANAISAANSLGQSSYGAAYYPWIYTPEPAANAVPGTMRLLPPGGSIVGQYVRTDATRGVFKAPAGIGNTLANVVALERTLTNAELDSLNVNDSQSPVNAIRAVPGSGLCVMGAKTLKPATADRFVPIRRTLNYIKKELVERTQFAIFEPNDQALWDQIREVLNSFLLQFWQSGGLRGSAPGQAYYVKCDATNNTANSIASGAVNIEVGIAVQYPAEYVVIRLGQFESGASVTEA